MTTSGATAFNPSNFDLVIESFERIGLRPTALTRDQMLSAYRSINLAMTTWANRGVNLWCQDLQTINLVTGQTTYNVPADTVQILDIYFRNVPQAPQTGDPTDRILYPISRTDYAALSDKVSQGTPNTYWFDRLSPIPTITLWPVPNAAAPGAIVQYYRMRRIQDSNLSGGQTMDIPFRFLDACAADVAARLAQKFAPAMWGALREDAMMQWKEAATADTERVSMFLGPDMGSYWS